MDFTDDPEAAGRLGWGPDKIDEMARTGFFPGQLAQFLDLDKPTKALVLRLLDQPAEADWTEFGSLPNGKALARWLMTLPAYRNAPDYEDEDGDGDE